MISPSRLVPIQQAKGSKPTTKLNEVGRLHLNINNNDIINNNNNNYYYGNNDTDNYYITNVTTNYMNSMGKLGRAHPRYPMH